MRRQVSSARLAAAPSTSPRLTFSGRSLIGNSLALLGTHGLNYLFPLILVPYLARVLGPQAWGLVMFAQAFAGILQFVVDYGFSLSAIRDVAINRSAPERLGAILGEVTAVKAILLISTMAGVLIFSPQFPHIGSQPLILWSALVWMAGQAFNMAWFYQGIEKVKPCVIADIASGAAATIAILLLIKTPDDAWKVLLLQGSASVSAAILTHWYATRYSVLTVPDRRQILARLRLGLNAFLYKLAVSLYSIANPFLLGWMAPASAVAYFSGADRIARALLVIVYPLAQALYPRVSYHAQMGSNKAQRLATIGLICAGLIGTVCAVGAIAAAPVLVRRLLGHRFLPAIEVLRVLSLLCPLISINTMLAYQWVLPRYLDRPLMYVTAVAGAVNVGMAVMLAPAYGSVGMAWAVVSAEVVVLAGCCFILLMRPDSGWKTEGAKPELSGL